MDLPQLGTIATNFCYTSNQMKEMLGKDFILREERFNGDSNLPGYFEHTPQALSEILVSTCKRLLCVST